jgi:SAM-dependent methyltransferase
MPHGHDHVHLDESHWAAWADHAELEGEVLLDFVTGAATAVAGLVGGPVRRVLDVGSGPGVGTAELARLFPDAEVVAVDASPAMLDRVGGRAARLGVGHRISTHAAELPGGLAHLGPVDVVWASMSLHHVGDEVAALRAMGAVLAAGGVLALAEFADGPMRVLPDDLGDGRPGLGARLEEANVAWFAEMRAGLPGHEPSADLAAMVAAAGLDVLADDVVVVRHDAPLTGAARRFAVDHLRRSRGRLEQLLDADDAVALEALEGRDDLVVDAARRIVLARRPG